MKSIALCTQNTLHSISYSRIAARDLSLSSQGWLPRLAWWLCLKLGLHFDRPIENTTYERVAIDEPTLEGLIARNQRDLDMIWNRRARYVVIAAGTAEALFGEIASRSFYAFEHQMRLGNGRNTEYRGLKIVIVPWIDKGLFLLPELEQP